VVLYGQLIVRGGGKQMCFDCCSWLSFSGMRICHIPWRHRNWQGWTFTTDEATFAAHLQVYPKHRWP